MSVRKTECEGVMGTDTMGRVLVKAKIENTDDLVLAKKGLLAADQVRSVEVIGRPCRTKTAPSLNAKEIVMY